MIGVLPERDDTTFELPPGQPPVIYVHPLYGPLTYVGIAEGKVYYKHSNPLEALAEPIKPKPLQQKVEDQIKPVVDAMLDAAIAYHQGIADALKKMKEERGKNIK